VRAITIAYHDVADDVRVLQSSARPGIALYTLGRQDFRNHLRSIRQEEARISSIQYFRRWEREVPVFLTFDDGPLNVYTCIADELERYGWRGHFFIITDWIGRPGFLERRQIRELHRRGHVIGSHSCSHPARISHLRWPDLAREWSESCSTLFDILGERVSVASVPNGCHTRKVGQAAAAAGIEVLFTSEPTTATAILDGCLILGRYCIRRHTPPGVSGAIAAQRTWPRWRQTLVWKAKKSVKALAGESYLAFRRNLISRVVSRVERRHALVKTD
jgi:hypothetical protein